MVLSPKTIICSAFPEAGPAILQHSDRLLGYLKEKLCLVSVYVFQLAVVSRVGEGIMGVMEGLEGVGGVEGVEELVEFWDLPRKKATVVVSVMRIITPRIGNKENLGGPPVGGGEMGGGE